MSDGLKSVLFVCTANRYRSPFAAAVFKKRLEDDGKPDRWRIGSAGTWAQAGFLAIPHALRKAQEFGLSLEKHRSVEISREIFSEHDLIIVMEAGHKEALGTEFPGMYNRVFLLSEIVDHVVYDISDPAKNMDEAEEIMDELYNLVQRGYSEICVLANEMSSD